MVFSISLAGVASQDEHPAVVPQELHPVEQESHPVEQQLDRLFSLATNLATTPCDPQQVDSQQVGAGVSQHLGAGVAQQVGAGVAQHLGAGVEQQVFAGLQQEVRSWNLGAQLLLTGVKHRDLTRHNN